MLQKTDLAIPLLFYVPSLMAFSFRTCSSTSFPPFHVLLLCSLNTTKYEAMKNENIGRKSPNYPIIIPFIPAMSPSLAAISKYP